MEITPHVHSVPAAVPTSPGQFPPNVFLVAGQRLALIDAGYGDDAAVESRVEYILSLAPLKLAYIVLSHSHPDHVAGAGPIRDRTGAQVVAHPLAAAQLRSQGQTVDREAGDGEALDLGGLTLEVVHTPGHSPEHICVLLREEGVLFAGDHILGMGTTVVMPPGGDMAHYMDSLAGLLGYDLRLICPGHGPVIRSPKRKIEELLRHRREREQQVLTCLRAGRRAVAELVAEIYPELHHQLVGMARSQVLAHLIKLEREGRVTTAGGEDWLLR